MDVSIRSARDDDDDYGAFVRLFPELEVDDPLPSRERWSRDLATTTVLAERAGRVVGYVYFQVLTSEDGVAGYVRNVVTAKEARRLGVGRALMTRVASILRERGGREWHLNVKPSNDAARALYASLGMTARHRARQLGLSWAAIEAMPRSTERASGGVAAPSEDALLEATFTLPRGLLADSRRRGRVVVRLEGARGVASFSPSLPGAFPFRVKAPELAPSLFDAVAPHRASDDGGRMNVVVEDDDALEGWLVAAGAERRLDILHYAGPL